MIVHSVAVLAGGIAVAFSSIALVTTLVRRDAPSPAALYALAAVVWLGVSALAQLAARS